MSLTSFIVILIFLLVVFQALQIYFFFRKQFLFGSIFIACFWGAFAFLAFNYNILFSSNFDASGQTTPKTIIINKGSTLAQITNLLYDSKIIRSKNYFSWSVNILGYGSSLKAGKFVVSSTLSNYALIKQLSASAASVQVQVTLVEGITAKDIASEFSRKMAIDSARFSRYVFDSAFAAGHNIQANNLEGYLFPETYRFNWGVSEREIIETLLREFNKNIPDSVYRKADEISMTFHEIVTLGSIIEGEAVRDDERSLISSVYHNRLKKGMRLQADPTIQYIIPDGPRRLLTRDLRIQSPYNTYRNNGLPPGPINNPGLKSIIAAAFPASESYLYFVASGDGHHTFTRTQAEHLEAKKKLDRMRRELRNKSRGK